MLYEKIDPEFIGNVEETLKRIILFDPSEVYSRITLDSFKRKQSIGMDIMFPTFHRGICACGCGRKLPERKRRWFSDDCQQFCLGVYWIIKGDSERIKWYIRAYLSPNCSRCNCEPYNLEFSKVHTTSWGHTYTELNSMAGVQLDHIVAVKNGGGGCWLGNYQLLCDVCHKQKSVLDRGFKPKQPAMQISKWF